ncbi:PiggyBac transposable element-derived protein 4 [Anthophora quadrimaculata]
MYKPDALYERGDDGAIGYSSTDDEIDTGHRSVHTIDYTSDSSRSSEASSVLQNVRKRVRPISSSDDSDVADDEWNWTEDENIVNIKEFTETPGINPLVLRTLGADSTPLCVLKQILSDDFFEMIVRETNRYADQMNMEHTTKMSKDWFPVTNDEIRAYFALCIIMSQVKKSKLEMYWSKRRIIETPVFSEIMPYKRFLSITHYLHFVNNETMSKKDRIRKIRPVVEYLNTKFQQLYVPEEDVVIDESLMKFRGRLNYVQFIASKRARFGIKFYKLCESTSGYCSRFKIYTGQDKIEGTDIPVSQSIVMELAEPILGEGYTLFLDNWYSSPELFKILNRNNTNVIGTVRKNRKNMPKKLTSYKLKRGDVTTLSCKGILCLRWRDKKDVYIMSSKHSRAEMVTTGKIRRKKGGEQENVIKPSCVIEYNRGMGGVDRQDQFLASFPLMRKSIKGYKKMFFYMFDIAVYNAYVLYSKLPNRTKQSMVNFRLNIAEDMLYNLSLPDYPARGRPSQSECPTRLQAKHWAHFPEHISSTEKKKLPTKRCRVCAKNNIRSETTWQCKKCLVPLHVPKCFEIFHTVQNY